MACDCLEKLDEQLKPKNLKVETMLAFGHDGFSALYPAMSCALIEKKRGQRAPVLAPTFCPFCGVRYKTEASS